MRSHKTSNFFLRSATLLLALVMGCSSSDGGAGPAGPPGANGTDGTNGSTGPTGPSGATGATGPTGATGASGAQGAIGDPGVSTGTVEGTTTNSVTAAPLAGVTLDFAPAAVPEQTTGNDGKYSVTMPAGSYQVKVALDQFTTQSLSVTVSAGDTPTELDIAMVPLAPVVVNAGADMSGAPGTTVKPSAAVTAYDGTTASTYAWVQTAGAVPLTVDGADTQSPTIHLADLEAYKTALVANLSSDEFPIADRFQILGINPYAIEESLNATFQVTVTTSSGSYTDTLVVSATAPFVVSRGIANVPLNIPVIVQAQSNTNGYSWSLTKPGSNSTATIDDTTSQWPIVIPDVAGKYTLTEANSGKSISFTAGVYSAGAITGLDADGNPTSTCQGCHDPSSTNAVERQANANFTTWAKSGHAQIFTQNIDDPAGHWSLSCAGCHTVGYDGNTANGGFDKAIQTDGWTPPPHGEPGLYAKLQIDDPDVFQTANIQCENCHGPNGVGHFNGIAGRSSVSSALCGSCHGEPTRHGRYQQWATSGHANYDLAISEGMGQSCARCHSSQGFLTYLPKLFAGNNGSLTSSDVTWDASNVEPQTCSTCHDPHAQGTTSGEPNTATVRLEGDVPMLPSGYAASGMGKGAVCMVCHNGRNGEHDDTTLASNTGSMTTPHHSTQGDTLMGENLYFVTPGQRAAHSFLANTCANCHLEQQKPPAEFSNNFSGTNHAFVTSTDICKNCHGAYDGGNLAAIVDSSLQSLGDAMAAAMQAKLTSGTVYVKPTYYDSNGVRTSAGSAFTLDLTNNTVVSITWDATYSDSTAFKFTMTNDVTITPSASCKPSATTSCTPYTGKVFYLSLASLTKSATATDYVYGVKSTMYAAYWNYIEITEDRSGGAHNPGVIMDAINGAIAASSTYNN